MTIDTNPKLKVKSVAIIGAGPSGIASLYELSRTTKEGKSLFGKKNVREYEDKEQLAFTKIVAFERNGTVGGVWSKSAYARNNRDPNLPTSDQIDFDEVDVTRADQIYQKIDIDENLERLLENSSVKNPVKVQITPEIAQKVNNQWRSSAAYDKLFTNVTNRYMAFSFDEKTGCEMDKVNSRYKHLPNLQFSKDVSDYLEGVVERNDLDRFIRFNSNVERVKKLENGKWEVIISQEGTDNGVKVLLWYKEYYDAIIIGNGKTVPNIPKIKNLFKFADKNRDKVQVKLAKSVQDPEFLRHSKKPLFIGSSVSSIDLLQYAFPRDIEHPTIYISRRSLAHSHNWLTSASYSKGIINKPEIEEFLPESNSIRFKDGTVESGFDAIVICCGYHMFYPFIDKSFIENAGQHALDFYQYTFSIADPTIALVGNTYAGFFFNRVEAQAAAIAGVWSNHSTLPNREEQIEKNRNKPDLITGRINDIFITPLIQLGPEDRPHPFIINKEKSDHVYHSAQGMNTIHELFFKIRNGEVDPFNIN